MLARFIGIRDQRCRIPYCDAPIRHIDHATPASRHGKTSALNGEGLCAACNYAKQAAGWQVETSIDDGGVHTTEITTPTRSHHHSKAPPQPRPLHIEISEVDAQILAGRSTDVDGACAGIRFDALGLQVGPLDTRSQFQNCGCSGGAKSHLSGFFGE